MNTQIIEQGTYNYLKGLDVADRSPKQQDDIDAYEAAHNLDDKSESAEVIAAPTNNAEIAPTIVTDAVEITQLNDDMPEDEQGSDDDTKQSDAPTNDAEVKALELVVDIEANEQTVNLLASFHNQFARFSPKMIDQDLQNLVAISQFANGFCKENQHHLVLTCSDKETAQKLVMIRSKLDFDYAISDREISYAVQGDLIKAPYGTHGIYLDTGVVTANTFKPHPDFKAFTQFGSKFIACVGAKKYDHSSNELVIAYVQEPIQFEDGQAPEDILTVLDRTDRGICTHRFDRQDWRDEFGDQIKAAIKSEALTELTFGLTPKFAEAWKPFLVIAKMISDDMFLAMYRLMMQYKKTAQLGEEYSVYAAIQLALPEYEAYVTKYGFSPVVSVKTIEVWLKYYGQTVAHKKVNDALTEGDFKAVSNKFCLGINTTGFDLKTLKDFVDSKLDMTKPSIEELVSKMKEAPTTQAEATKDAA